MPLDESVFDPDAEGPPSLAAPTGDEIAEGPPSLAAPTGDEITEGPPSWAAPRGDEILPDPSVGTGDAATFDFASIFNTGVKLTGDVTKVIAEATKSNAPPASTPAQPSKPATPATAPPTPTTLAPMIPTTTAFSVPMSSAQTALIVGAAVVGTGALITIIALAVRSSRRRRSV